VTLVADEHVIIGLGLDSPVVYFDSGREEYIFSLDPRTAEAVVFAVRALAAEYESVARERRRAADGLPCQSYGARNRLRIAERHERLAWRLRMVETAYRRAE
jgi:hypothetical protein